MTFKKSVKYFDLALISFTLNYLGQLSKLNDPPQLPSNLQLISKPYIVWSLICLEKKLILLQKHQIQVVIHLNLHY